MSEVQQRIDELVKGNEVLLFMKGSASFLLFVIVGKASLLPCLVRQGISVSQVPRYCIQWQGMPI